MSLEDIFSKLAMTTVTTVSRIALSHATNAAIRNVTTYISQQTSTDSQVSNKELVALQRQLDLKIKNLKVKENEETTLPHSTLTHLWFYSSPQ
jgi:hypothetical protein